jgi:hypothetical protein
MKIGNSSLHHYPVQISDLPLKSALTGFRPGWQHPNAATPPTFNVNSNTEPARVRRFEYADVSEDDTKEAISTSVRKPTSTKDNKSSKVRSTKFYPKLIVVTAGIVFEDPC